MVACEQPSTMNALVLTGKDSIKQKQLIRRAIGQIYTAEKHIRTGDLVTRTGADFTSESLRNLCRRDKTYSHCGIASWENDSLFIYHAMGGEWNPDERLRRDSWLQFAEPYTNRGFGHFRYELNDSGQNTLIKEVHRLYGAGLTFDMKFDLSSDDKMYCAEFIAKSFERTGRMVFNRSKIEHFEFIGVDDLFLHPGCKKIYGVVYK